MASIPISAMEITDEIKTVAENLDRQKEIAQKLYKPIKPWQTRLILLHKKDGFQQGLPPTIELFTADLVALDSGAVVNDNLVQYDALSYAWGFNNPSATITCNGFQYPLTEHLLNALESLRQTDIDRYLWIDALCINQHDDPEEKSNQVKEMLKIYSRARSALVWLGNTPISVESSLHCHSCRLPGEYPKWCMKHKAGVLKDILQNTWFTRTWVRQEVYGARRLVVFWNKFQISWKRLVDTFEAKEPGISITQINPRRVKSSGQNFMILDNTYQQFQKFPFKTLAVSEWRRKMYISDCTGLLQLLSDGSNFHATDPKDHIYSVLAMLGPKVKDEIDLVSQFPIDYRKTFRQVCTDVTKYLIRENGDMGILKLCLAQKDKSHAIDWSNVEWGAFEVGHRKRWNSCTWINKLNESKDIGGGMLQFPAMSGSVHVSNLGQTAQDTWSKDTAPLLLKGRLRGILRKEFANDRERDMVTQFRESKGFEGEIFVLDEDISNWEARSKTSNPEHDNNAPETVSKETKTSNIYVQFGVIHTIPRTSTTVHRINSGFIYWDCFSGREGDAVVELDTGSDEVILRACDHQLYEISGWVYGEVELGPTQRKYEDDDTDHLATFEESHGYWDLQYLRPLDKERRRIFAIR